MLVTEETSQESIGSLKFAKFAKASSIFVSLDVFQHCNSAMSSGQTFELIQSEICSLKGLFSIVILVHFTHSQRFDFFAFGDFVDFFAVVDFFAFRLRLCPIKARGSWALYEGMQSIESANAMHLIRRRMVRSLGIVYRINWV